MSVSGRQRTGIVQALLIAGVFIAAMWIGRVAADPTAALRAPIRHITRVDGFFPPPSLPKDNQLTEEGIELGRRMFFDKELSKDGTVACASCHKPEHAFADGGPSSFGISHQKTRRNSMPLFNLAWRRNFFWDGRSTTVREQVMHPLTDPKEMAADADALAKRLGKDPRYAELFHVAFGPADPTSQTIALAFEQFLLSQISQDAKLDKVRRGETSFTLEEARGLELFFTEYSPGRGMYGADCFHCHGNVLFTNERFANNGLIPREDDTGRMEATSKEYDKWTFKVPTLRNVELTGPYMHDGRFETLEQVVDHYDHGVTTTLTLDPNIEKHGGPMKLSADDKKALVAFLKTLTDRDFIDRAKKLEPAPL